MACLYREIEEEKIGGICLISTRLPNNPKNRDLLRVGLA